MPKESKVPALEKADKIFEYLYYRDAATQAEITKNLNFPKATTHRLLLVLTELGYISLEKREYSLGEKFHFLSSAQEKYKGIKQIVYPYLEELSLKFKETFKVSVLEGKKIKTIGKVESNDMVRISVSENAIFPLHAGAASKILICQLSKKKLEIILEDPLPQYTKNTIIEREKLEEELRKINLQKIAFDKEEHSRGISAVALPIFNQRNQIIASISCPYFSEEMSEEKLEKIVQNMKKSCQEISKKIKVS